MTTRLLPLSVPVWMLLSMALGPSCAHPGSDPTRRASDDLRAHCGTPAAFAHAVAPDVAPSHETARRYLEVCGRADAIALLSALVTFPTVSSEKPAAESPAIRAMGEHLSRWASAAGLRFASHGSNDVFEIALGKGPRSVAFVMHGDVVPVSDGASAPRDVTDRIPPGWTVPPFAVTEKDGRLYGRGTEDDKGPIAAVLVVLRTLEALGLQPNGEVLAIIGNGEESNWSGMRAYAESQPHARYVISMDAGFPVVIAESGFVTWKLKAPFDPPRARPGCPSIAHASGGQFLTQVPGEAMMKLVPAAGSTVDALRAAVDRAVAEEHVAREGTTIVPIASSTTGGVLVTVTGSAVHSSVAEEGHNALWGLAGVAKRLGVCPSGPAALLSIVGSLLDGDHYGERLGLAYAHDVMGKLMVAPTVFRANAEPAELEINMRRPAGLDEAAFGARLDQALARIQREISEKIVEGERYVGTPAMADTKGPLVSTLLEIYREKTKDAAAEPISIRGGTYARLFPGAVSFGPSLPGRPYRGHAPDEYLDLDALDLILHASFEAIVRLTATATTAAAAGYSPRQ